MFKVSQHFSELYPKAHAGLLVMRGASNPAANDDLEARKREVELDLRSRFAAMTPKELDSIHPFSVYSAYYRKFDKTYHVAGQLKSIVFKDKSIPSVAALVEAMFIAELKNGLLTAGHDLDRLELPLYLEAATGEESYTLMRGSEQLLKPADMYIRDGKGILSSILYGPDQRTQITEGTRNAAFTVYAPEGISPAEVEAHLKDIRDLVLLVTPSAQVEVLEVFGESNA